MEPWIQVLVLLGLLCLGWIAGGYSERRHIRSLLEREDDYSDVLVSDLKTFPKATVAAPAPTIVFAEVVIAADYLKVFFASLRRLVGGELGSYRSLMERARREVILRLIERARVLGYNALANVRVEAADVGGNASRRGLPMVSVLAQATAYCAEPPPPRF